ncbi:MAG: DHH family phosphoesterase [Hyphomonadaceae bacterium]|nr:DHH family phosphoesterase [Hyphomonadaceae bacterium]
MADFDVFNGDADGIISLVQLRRAAPRPAAVLVTGRKRDIALLDRVNAGTGDQVTVLDISMLTNGDDLRRILDAGADVFYADHHNAGDIPQHDNLTAIIDTSPETCTAFLINSHLGGRYLAWAVTAAFGDNFPKVATRAAEGHDLPLEKLERLGTLVNYNGYGASVDDLHFHPADLYDYMKDFDTPMEFLEERDDIYLQLNDGYESDMAGAERAKVIEESDKGFIIELEDHAGSRRVSGVYGNRLARDHPARAHAILTRNQGSYVVSVRAPLENRVGADELCLKFPTGGGRSAAAGINALPFDRLEDFVHAFNGRFAG